MKKNLRTLIFLLLTISSHMLFADLSHVAGTVVNGRNGSEKCDGVKVSLVIDSQTEATAYTDESGYFSIDMSGLDPATDLPADFALDQNYPNPFNESTTLPFTVSRAGQAKLEIYDLRGHKVRTLSQAHYHEGYYSPRWDGRNAFDQVCPQGIYFYVLSMNGRTEIRKMTLTNAGTLSSHVTGNPGTLAKPASGQVVELVISDRDIEDKTFTYNFDQLPSTLDAGELKVHVYAHIREELDPLYAMEGEDARDTLNIYFEKPFTLSSNDVDIDWTFTEDSLVAVHYTNITESPVILRVNEPGESKNTYGRAYFDIDTRPTIWSRQLRRAYIGIPYSGTVKVQDQQGDVQITLEDALPLPLSISGNTLLGTPASASETMLHFTLEDDRGIPVRDSALLIIGESNDIDFNDYVVDVLREYHRDGRYPYLWVSGYHGVTHDLFYKGTKIAKANADSSHSTYCCGLTFEAYFRAITRLQADLGMGEDINGMSASNFSNFISKWFVQSTLGDGPGIALDSYGLGDKITEMADVQKGDFVQIWRTTGSGHSVIFINWTTNAVGDTTGMRYWSTQTSTNGVNYNTEYFDGHGGTVDPAHTYYSRGRKPEDFEGF